MILRPPDALITSHGAMGYWTIIAKYWDGTGWRSVDLTTFRNARTSIGELSTTDPFGPNTANLTFPAISILEQIPGTDTPWLRAGTMVDITYTILNPESSRAAQRMRGVAINEVDSAMLARTMRDTYDRLILQMRMLPKDDYFEDRLFAMERKAKVFKSIGESAETLAEEGIDSPTASVTWEGIMASRTWAVTDSSSSLDIQCIGAMKILDDRVAQKIIFNRPMPYEWVIGRHFSAAEMLHPTRLAPMLIEWPEWWEKRYRYDPELPDYLVPGNVVDGQNWTGMTTRDFGRWDAVLTSTIQGLLSVMFTPNGQFTLMLDPGRVPVLRHRDHLFADSENTLMLDAITPGLQIDLNEDLTMTANVIYGTARSQISGTSYTGLRYSSDGSASCYDPFESHGSVDPGSIFRDESMMRKELYVTFSDGMYPAEAIEKARSQIMRTSAPGLVGSLRLRGIDPMVRDPDGEMVPYPSDVIRAGDTIRVRGLFGSTEGRIFTITEVSSNPDTRETNLTVDTKFRDYMTVREVMDRGRDALRPWHTMTVGNYNINIPDALLPWDYGAGSGFIPYESTPWWQGAPQWLAYPWEEWARRRPPSNSSYTGCYLKVPAMTSEQLEAGNPDAPWYATMGTGWNRITASTTDTNCYVVLASSGEVQLMQIAAFDYYGKLKRIPFHVSIWHSNAASSESTPLLHTMDYEQDPAVEVPFYSYYTDGDGVQHSQLWPDGGRYPFYENAWEQYNTDGTKNEWINDSQPTEDGLIVGYGNYWEKAGYWPNTGRSESDGMSYPTDDVVAPQATGLLVDETGWSFNFEQYNSFDLNDPTKNSLIEHANATVLIFCESQTDTYFLGRCFRKEYGA